MPSIPPIRVFESVFIRPLKGESRGDIRSCVLFESSIREKNIYIREVSFPIITTMMNSKTLIGFANSPFRGLGGRRPGSVL